MFPGRAARRAVRPLRTANRRDAAELAAELGSNHPERVAPNGKAAALPNKPLKLTVALPRCARSGARS